MDCFCSLRRLRRACSGRDFRATRGGKFETVSSSTAVSSVLFGPLPGAPWLRDEYKCIMEEAVLGLSTDSFILAPPPAPARSPGALLGLDVVKTHINPEVAWPCCLQGPRHFHFSRGVRGAAGRPVPTRTPWAAAGTWTAGTAQGPLCLIGNLFRDQPRAFCLRGGVFSESPRSLRRKVQPQRNVQCGGPGLTRLGLALWAEGRSPNEKGPGTSGGFI